MKKHILVLTTFLSIILISVNGCKSGNEQIQKVNNDLQNKINSQVNSKTKDFWDYFEKQSNRIYEFEKENDKQRLLDEIQSKIELVNSSLTYSIGPLKDGKREFIISADGIQSAFPAVKELVEDAVKDDRFRIIAFRPRTDLTEVRIGNITLKYDQVYFKWERGSKDKLDVSIYIKGYKEINNDIESAVFVLLDNSIGEYDVETKIGGIHINLYTNNSKDTLPFSQFRSTVDENIKK